MSIKSAKKLGFWMALSMMIGSIVGVGIFFKAQGILRANDWSGWSTLTSWILGGVMSLAAAISFSEIGSMKLGVVKSLGGWAEATSGKKFGYFTRFNYAFFYYAIYVFVLAAFSGEVFFKLLDTFNVMDISKLGVWAPILLGFGLMIFFILMNFFSIKTSGYFQLITTILKWIPLVSVAVIGLSFATTNNIPSTDGTFGQNAFTNGHKFTLTGMLAAVPAVLFAYDAFLSAPNMRNKLEKPEKIPFIILVGMISVFTLYMLIALAATLHGSGNVASGDASTIWGQVFSAEVSKWIGKIAIVFLAISTFGVTNGMVASATQVISMAVDSESFMGVRKLRRRFGEVKTQLIYILFITIFWGLVISIPAMILNTDTFIDGVSNFPVISFFGIYAWVILKYTLQRKRFSTHKINNILFYTMSWLAIIGITFFVGYEVIYDFMVGAWMHQFAEVKGWGLYVGSRSMIQWEKSVIFMVFSAIFFITPYLNKIGMKKFCNQEAYISTI